MYKFTVYYFANEWLPLKHFVCKRVPACLNEKFKKVRKLVVACQKPMYDPCDDDRHHAKV